MNKKAIAVFVIILVLLLGFAYYELSHNSPKGITRTVNSTTNTTVIINKTKNTTIITTNTTNTTKTTNSTGNSTVLSNCISTNSTFPITNGNFGTGTFTGWNLTGLGFLNSTGQPYPTNLTFANANNGYYGSPWADYDGDFFASTYHGGVSLSPGNLTSNPFEVREPYLNFRIVSPQNGLLYVELLHDGKPFRVNHYNTLNASGGNNPQSTFVNATMPLLNYVCQNVSVRVVAGVVGSLSTKQNYIAVGDFVQSKSNLETRGTLVNSSV